MPVNDHFQALREILQEVASLPLWSRDFFRDVAGRIRFPVS
jgi:hypothetical protein